MSAGDGAVRRPGIVLAAGVIAFGLALYEIATGGLIFMDAAQTGTPVALVSVRRFPSRRRRCVGVGRPDRAEGADREDSDLHGGGGRHRHGRHVHRPRPQSTAFFSAAP
jgi:hypothetical protein